ncbi:MAG: HAMP domain-containing protein, partial [gamma proteobacterium symbiont of Ctena orbiculata]
LIAAADLTFYTMLGLLVAVVLTVVIVAYLLATGITVPIRILRRAIAHVHHGNLGYRIHKERNDELGLLFSEYHRMADTLLKQRDECQHQLQQQTVTQITDGDDDTTNMAHEQEIQASPAPAQDEQELSAPDPEFDDATRIMPPKQNNT